MKRIIDGYFNEITLLKVIATFCITWFHFKWTVPAQLSPLFIGGAIGNSLFFFASGFLLKFKDEQYPCEWLIKKFLRLLPSIWVFYLGSSLLCSNYTFAWYNLLYPTTFWFVNAILIYFVISYVLFAINQKFFNQKSMIPASSIGRKRLFLMIFWGHFLYFFLFAYPCNDIIMDNGGLQCWFFWFAFFIIGQFCRLKNISFKGSYASLFKLALSIIAFFAYKKFAINSSLLLIMQSVFIPLLLAWITYEILQSVSFLIRLRYPSWLKKFFVAISNLTLDIYIVQMILINAIMPIVPFPFNIIISFISILIIAFFNNRLASVVSNKINHYVDLIKR